MAEHNQGNSSNRQRRDQEEYNDQGQSQQYGNSRYRAGQNQQSGYGGQSGEESQYGGSSFQGSNYGGGYSSGRGNFAGGNSGQNQQSHFGNEYNHGSDFNREVEQHPEFNTWGGAAGMGVSRQAYDGGYNQHSEQQHRQQQQNQYNDQFRRQRESQYGQQQHDQQYGNSNYGNQSQQRGRQQDRNRSNDRNWLNRTADEVASWFGDEEAERRRKQDEMRNGRSQHAGPHKGKGPKGYRRSDERIREDISDRLSDDPYVDATDIDIEVKGAEVILTGTVDSRDAKRRAEDVVESISGITHVENRIRVANKNSDYNRGTSGGSNDDKNRSINSMG